MRCARARARAVPPARSRYARPSSGGRCDRGIVPAVELERHAQAPGIRRRVGCVKFSTRPRARDVRVGQDLVDVADRALRHAGGIERGGELVMRLRGDGRGEPRHHLVAAAHPSAVALQLGLAAPGFEPERPAERQPMLVARRDVQVTAVGAAEARRGHAAGMLGAEPRRHLAEREVARGGEREQRDLAVEHGEVDVAAPVRSRARPCSAARMAIATHRPEVRSATGRPGFTGAPPRSPVRLMMPPMAWKMVS